MEHMGIVNDRKNNNNIVNDREFLLTINHMYIYIYPICEPWCWYIYLHDWVI